VVPADTQGESAAQARLVGAVIQLARTLGVPVIAEGIERPARLDRLLELGGSLGQGFLLGRPTEFGELELRSTSITAV
jgi:EAL domain-containing protein (putative c-di-GMP-specific phosphodiesterase class I)